MGLILVTYAGASDPMLNDRLIRAQHALNESAVRVGFGRMYAWNRSGLVKEHFYTEHREILDRPRGGGYWLWKPYVILNALRESADGDVVVYWDVGRIVPHTFRRRIDNLIHWCLQHGGILPGVPIGMQGRWTKRDCFHRMNCDLPRFWNSPQIQATFSLWSGRAAAGFVTEWLQWCTDALCLTDDPNVCGLRNLPGFVGHRHDQSILSNLCLEKGIASLDANSPPPASQSKDINAWAEALDREPCTSRTRYSSGAHGNGPAKMMRPNRANAATRSTDIDLLNLRRRAWQHFRVGDFELAEQKCHRVLQTWPNEPSTLHLLGLLRLGGGAAQEGLHLLRRSAALDSASIEFQNNLALGLAQLGHFDEALAILDGLVQREPTCISAHTNRGLALQMLSRFSEAAAAHRRALNLASARDVPAVATNLGDALEGVSDGAGAEAAYRRAIEADALCTRASRQLARLLCNQARHDEALGVLRDALSLRPSDGHLHSHLLYAMQYAPRATRNATYAEHLAWGRRHGDRAIRGLRPRMNSSNGKLRVGYLSPDLRQHSMATFIEPILTAHDRQSISVTCYSAVRSPDAVTARIRSSTDRWRDISRCADADVAEMIRKDEIDILVDLTGHGGNNRLPVFALQPAPAQISYLGYPDTTGLAEMHYRISDPFLDPVGASEKFYSEQIVRLPQVVACYRAPDDMLEVAALPADQNRFVTFGCLNHPAKVTVEAMTIWCRILQVMPGSRLVLRYDFESTNLNRVIAAAGIAPQRVERVRCATSRREYLSTFSKIDIALDPFPYNGHTTSCDGFWMGVPLVTLAGDRYSARMGVSLLMNLSLPEFIASAPDEYVRIAARLAADTQRLRGLRRAMRQRMRSSPIMDAFSITRAIETIYRQCLRRSHSGEEDVAERPAASAIAAMA